LLARGAARCIDKRIEGAAAVGTVIEIAAWQKVEVPRLQVLYRLTRLAEQAAARSHADEEDDQGR